MSRQQQTAFVFNVRLLDHHCSTRRQTRWTVQYQHHDAAAYRLWSYYPSQYRNVYIIIIIIIIKPEYLILQLKSFQATRAHRAALIFVSVALSRSCKSADTALVCRVEWLFSSQLIPVPIYTAWWTEAHVCEQLAKSCYVKRSGRDSNLRSFSCKSDALSTTPSRHIFNTLPGRKSHNIDYCYAHLASHSGLSVSC